MRIEKWIYNGKEIDVKVLDKDEIEKNEDVENPELEKTLDLEKIKDKKSE